MYFISWVVILLMWIEVEILPLGLPIFGAQVVLAIICYSNTLKTVTGAGCW